MSKAPSRIRGSFAQRGISLIELMIAMTLGLILVAGLATLIARQSKSRTELDKSHQLIDNGRFGLTTAVEDIQHAGYYGYYSVTPTALTALPDPCAVTAAAIDASLAMPLQGYDAPATVPSPLSACLPDANHVPGTDIVIVRRVEAVETPGAIGSLTAGQVYVQATASAKITAIGVDPTPAAPSVYTLTLKDGTTPAPIRKYVEHIYFVSPCDVYAAGSTTCTAAADNGRPIPTLKRLELTVSGATPSFTTIAIAEGIENMQLDYVVDTTGDGTPNAPIAAPTVSAWPNVMAVQLYLVARNLQNTGDYDGSTRSFNLGVMGSVGPFTDTYKRHVFSGNARLLAVSGRKE
ncbi:MAG: PilW family protein [Variovorax sp.]